MKFSHFLILVIINFSVIAFGKPPIDEVFLSCNSCATPGSRNYELYISQSQGDSLTGSVTIVTSYKQYDQARTAYSLKGYGSFYGQNWPGFYADLSNPAASVRPIKLSIQGTMFSRNPERFDATVHLSFLPITDGWMEEQPYDGPMKCVTNGWEDPCH
ncbi:MAG: hypothetical protein JNM39_15215 [Bdellovibrionaceae bacterium]|nr:hypothetical protein [Pseudobdellovibrionaceae bacterium]